MSSPAIEKARAQQAKAQSALDAALIAGKGTAEAREALELAALRVAELTDAEAAAEAPDPAGAEALDAQVREMVAATEDRIAAEIADLHQIQVPIVAVDPLAARRLLEARQDAAAHEGLVLAHKERMDALRARLADLEGQRSEIIARRTEGHQEPGDASQISLLDADMEGLRNLIDRAAQDAPGMATGTSHARLRWEAALAETRGAAAVALVMALEDRLCRAAALVHELPFSRRPLVGMGIRALIAQGGGKW
jgi:hypothetical protein